MSGFIFSGLGYFYQPAIIMGFQNPGQLQAAWCFIYRKNAEPNENHKLFYALLLLPASKLVLKPGPGLSKLAVKIGMGVAAVF